MCMASESLYCVFWIRKTIRKVIIVVAVFITNCQVLLNPNIGPVIAQPRMTMMASTKATGRPVTLAVHFAKRVNHDLDFGGLIMSKAKALAASPMAVYE